MTHLKDDPKLPIDQADELGYTAFGPVVLRFCAWLADQAESQKLTHLYFLSREGYFLLSLFKKYLSLGLRPPLDARATYLYMSRRAAYGAAEKTPAALKAMLLAGPFKGNLYDLLENRFGISAEFCKHISLQNVTLSIPEDLEKTLHALQPALPQLNEKAKAERELFNEYLKQEGFFDVETAALVDLGYSGSIQRWMHAVTEKRLAGFYFATTRVVHDWESDDNKVYSCFATDCGAYRSPPVYRYALALESWLTAPTGQVVRFVRPANGVVPEFAPAGRMQEQFPVAAAVAKGVERYFDDIAFLAKFDSGWEKYLETSAQDIMAAALESHAFSDMLNVLSVEDAFCGEGEISLSARISELMLDMKLSETVLDKDQKAELSLDSDKH